MRSRTAILVVVLASAAGCYVGSIDDAVSTRAPNEPSGADGGATGVSPSSSGSGTKATGLPCDVAKLLAEQCVSCHGAAPSAPMALVTYEDLVAPAKSDPTKKVAELVLTRMKDQARPMPPSGPKATPSEIAAFEAWLASGSPRAACDTSPIPTAPSQSVTPVCTSGLTWSGRKGVTMQPGRACISCHTQQGDDGPLVQIGGTVYPTMHEPDLCIGVDGASTDARVVVTDANGRVISMPVNGSGNFAWLTSQAQVRFPIRAKVVSGGKERVMATPQMTGDCNSCHTVKGEYGAPGRIAMP